MVKEEINFVTEFVQKTLGISPTEAASLLFDIKIEDGSGTLKTTALPTLLDKDKTRIQSFKDLETQAHDKGFNKAKGEALTKFEKDLKDKFGIVSDKQGLDLIEFAVAEKLKLSGDPKDDDKIKRSSVYMSMVDQLTKEKTDAIAIETTKFNDLQTSIQKETTFKSVSDRAMDLIKNELQPILPEGKTTDGKSKADVQIQRFLKELSGEYQFESKDGKMLISKEGKLLEDAHGRMIDFNELIKSRAAEVWDFKQGEHRQSAGNNNNNDPAKANANKGYTGPIPKTGDEYVKMINEAPDDASKQAITKAWGTKTKT